MGDLTTSDVIRAALAFTAALLVLLVL